MARHVPFTRLVAAAIAVTLLAVDTRSVSAAPCWQPPTAGVIVDPFRAPPCPYCSGNRGIEYRTRPGSTVRAVATGEVTWSGSIAGVRWVVVRHGDGWRATYGRLATVDVAVGDRVVARTPVGTASMAVYFGLRVDDRYVDPEPFLGRLAGRPRLVPIDGTRARPAPPPQWRCGR